MTGATEALLNVAAGQVATLALSSGIADDLALITRPDVALTQWVRVPVAAIPAGDLGGVRSLRLEGDPADAEASVLEGLAIAPPRPWQRAVARDVGRLARRFADIAGCDDIALRLERVDGDACRRFHADYVPLRLITTYAGRGTEWRLTDEAAPVRHMAVGAVGIFKGCGSGAVGIVHRSPPIADRGEQRLVLVIDALRPDDD